MMGSSGQDSVWAGTFRGFLNNISLRASSAQLGYDIVDQMLVQFKMGSEDRNVTNKLTGRPQLTSKKRDVTDAGPQLTI